MTRNLLIFGLVLLGRGPGAGAADEAAADRITLRDGSVVLGLVTSATSGPRGAVEFLVRRDWAERNVKAHLAEWDRAAAATLRRAVEQRRDRLASWRREREQAPGVGPDDRIVRWIDRSRSGWPIRRQRRRTALVERAAAAGRGPRAAPPAGRGRPAAPPGVARRGPRSRGHEASTS